MIFRLPRPGVARDYTGKVIATFAVKATGAGATAGSLSGGNLQKYIMGREILQNPTVLVVSQPTWGVDAGAAAAIRQALVDLAAPARRSWSSRRISTSCSSFATRWRSSTTAASQAHEGRRCVDRGARTADGRRSWRPGGARPKRELACGSGSRSGLSRAASCAMTRSGSVVLTMIVGAIIFSVLGYDGSARCTRCSSRRSSPPTNGRTSVKASPLILIGSALRWATGPRSEYRR